MPPKWISEVSLAYFRLFTGMAVHGSAVTWACQLLGLVIRNCSTCSIQLQWSLPKVSNKWMCQWGRVNQQQPQILVLFIVAIMQDILGDIQAINELCHTCCFEHNFASKSQAEGIVLNLVKHLVVNADEVQVILKGHYSDTVVFVFSEYIFKGLKDLEQLKLERLLGVLLEEFKTWYEVSTGSFNRYGKRMEKYVVNSVARNVGEIVKMIVIGSEEKEQFLRRFEFKNSFKLVFWRYVTDTISQIDTSLGFLVYRSLVFTFQDYAIPVAIASLTPYFKTLTDNIRMNELAVLQENLSVEEKNQFENSPHKRILTFNQEELAIATAVLELLSVLLNYPFSISYGEYDMDNPYEHSVIYYPDAVSNKILEGDFYESLFFLTERFVLELPQHPLLPTCIQCLKQIVLCRVTYSKKTDRQKFVKESLTGILRLMKIVQDPVILLDIIQFNTKLLGNVGLKKLRKYPVFLEWLHLLEDHLRRCLFRQPFKLNEPTFFICFQLIEKVIAGFRNEKMLGWRGELTSFVENLFSEIFLKIINEAHPLDADLSIRKLKQLRSASSEFFGCLKQLILSSYQKNICLISNIQQQIFTKVLTEDVNPNILINLNLLVCELTSPSMITSSYPYGEFSTGSLSALSKIINNQINFTVQFYKSIGSRYQNTTLNMVTLIYLEILLVEFCGNIHSGTSLDDAENSLMLESKIFKLVEHSNEANENFLSYNINLVMSHLNSNDERQIYYALDILSSCVMKLKWSLKRSYFKKMPIMKSIMDFCLGVSLGNFKDKKTLKCRTQIFKIVTLLGFDDCLDSYKEKLDFVFDSLDKSNLITLIYDIRGMAEQIDTSSIFRHFLKKASPFIIAILDAVTVQDLNNEDTLKNTIKLNQKMFHNHLQRINSASKTAPLLYELLGNCIPRWQTILVFLETQISIEPDKHVSSSYHILQCLNKVIEGNYINFSLLQSISPNSTPKYITSVLRFLGVLHKSQVLKYLKVKKAFLTCCKHIFESLNLYIYQIDSNDPIDYYVSLFSACMMMLFEQFKQSINGNDKNNQFTMICDFLHEALIYEYVALLEVHLTGSHQRAKIFKEALRQRALEMFMALLNTSVECTNKYNIEKLTRFLGMVVRIYSENGSQLIQRIRELYPHSNMDLFVSYCDSCVGQDKSVWYGRLSLWLDSLKEEHIQLEG